MSSQLAPAQEEEHLRLYYLDGLRGLAALYVVFHHAILEVTYLSGWLSDRWNPVLRWTSNGQVAVQLFIVLSGYCLMLPVARSGGLKGGWLPFIKRRARRILPPYYAALALALALDAALPGVGAMPGSLWNKTFPVFTPGILISHALLLHDLRGVWMMNISYPLWTIAPEWQIYFVFVFLLLPLWRRGGIVLTVAFALIASLVLSYSRERHFYYACPSFLFLFGVGMFAAVMTFPNRSRWLGAARDRLPWGWLMIAGWGMYVAVMSKHFDEPYFFISPPFVILAGPAVFCTLMCCTNSARHRRGHNVLLRLCEWQPVVILGTFSYSLYLVHAPVLAAFTLALHRCHASGEGALAAQVFLAVPVAVAAAYVFHLVAERPFLRGHPRSLARAEKAAILDTAP